LYIANTQKCDWFLCVLVWYPEALTKLFFFFFVDSLGFSIFSCHLQVKSFISVFPICMPLFLFSCLITLAWVSIIMSNKNDESGWYHYLAHSLKGENRCFCRCPSLGWGSSHLILVYWEFLIKNGCWILSYIFCINC
jgi:hypothetical protein